MISLFDPHPPVIFCNEFLNQNPLFEADVDLSPTRKVQRINVSMYELGRTIRARSELFFADLASLLIFLKQKCEYQSSCICVGKVKRRSRKFLNFSLIVLEVFVRFLVYFDFPVNSISR